VLVPDRTAVRERSQFGMDQPITESLMVPFAMVVNEKFSYCPPQGRLTEQNHAIQTRFLNRADKAFGIRI
jgi:hypothetical protein